MTTPYGCAWLPSPVRGPAHRSRPRFGDDVLHPFSRRSAGRDVPPGRLSPSAGIAERIAATLRSAGLAAEARPANEVEAVDDYEAFVVGSATYMFHWLKDATRFVKRHGGLLARRPVRLFSSGPLGTERVDQQGVDVLESARPKEFAELAPLIDPRGMQVFFGAWDPEAPPIGLIEHVIRRLPAKDTMPAGDFRDWAAIDTWALEVAVELHELVPDAPRQAA